MSYCSFRDFRFRRRATCESAWGRSRRNRFWRPIANPDFELLAKSFGAWGRALIGAGQLPDAFDEAFQQPGLALLAVPVDYGENVKLTQRLGNLNFSI